MNFFHKFFAKGANQQPVLDPVAQSSQLAKERLQLVLVHDRVKLSPELLETIKEEIIAVISKHIDIDRNGMEVTLSKGDKIDKLTANIPVKRSHQYNEIPESGEKIRPNPA